MAEIEEKLGPGDMVLLGAGASAQAGIPTSHAMTRALVERIGNRGYPLGPTDTLAALHFVCGTLISHEAALGQNPYASLDVERVFAAVELLAERNTLEVTPFVSSWLPAVDTWDTKASGLPPFFDKKFSEALVRPSRLRSTGRMIVSLVDERMSAIGSGGVYEQLATTMLDALRDLLRTTEKETSYLSPLTEVAGRDSLTIASLNYDLAIEQVAASQDVSCDLGIAGWVRNGKWRWSGSGVRLLKLHGSIDWHWVSGPDRRRGHFPSPKLEVADPSGNKMGDPALVFGHRGKLRADGPFLGLLAQLERFLSLSERLVVIGYSFRDNHVNEILRRWLSDKRERNVLVVDPNWPSREEMAKNDFRAELEENLICPRGEEVFDDRLRVWRTECSEALARLK